MRKFISGLALGLLIAGTAPAVAAQLVGNSGYLSGWSVTYNGEELCYMPYIWTSTKEIECD